MQLEEILLFSKEFQDYESTREEVKAPEPVEKIVVDEAATKQAYDDGFAAGRKEASAELKKAVAKARNEAFEEGR
jgi:cell fate (sporulation/competence/biofilm development) regulator YlbF (YheA/YmcA/DUF963 family)